MNKPKVCFFCGKEIDSERRHISVEVAGEVKSFCPGPLPLLDEILLLTEEEKADKASISRQGLCSQIFRIEQMTNGKACVVKPA